MKELWHSLTPAEQINSIFRFLYYFLAAITVILGALGIDKFVINANAKSEANINLTTQIGEELVVISPSFNNAWQACWYYNSKYKNLYPYIAINDLQNPKEDEYLFIRAIAPNALWEGDKCEKNQRGEVQLIGTEKTFHEIEIKSENSNFIHIANSYAIYRSRLVFDDNGRIIDRHIVKEDNFGHEISHSYKKISLKDLEVKKDKKGDYLNFVKIFPVQNSKNKDDNYAKADKKSKYMEAARKYLDKRENLHIRLGNKGCGIIATEPIRNENSSKNEKPIPSITFLCFGNHVRVMERE